VLVCENNPLTNLDVTNNVTLNRLQCGNTNLTNLDVSKNTELTILSCENNRLTSLDLSFNSDLSTLNCGFNQLSELDVSKNTSLTTIDCNNNDLCRLNIKNGNNSNAYVNFSANLNLNCVVVDNTSNNHNSWTPSTFSNYVSSQNDCSDFVNVSALNNIITNSFYILPTLTYGNYYTQSGANGTALFAGNIISTSQTIYIYNESICASNESRFSVLITDEDYYIPKYFTPNNDGNRDFWSVQDFTNTIKNITIFDRYGKLLKSLLPNSEGWNGTFRGKLLETNDYWYAITLNTGSILKGHFTLKR
jgi:gliding motility-associated-like protein